MRPKSFYVAGWIVGLTGNLLTSLCTFRFALIPAGSFIGWDDMTWGVNAFMSALVVAIVGVPLSITDIRRGRLSGILGIVLCVTQFFIYPTFGPGLILSRHLIKD